MRIVSHRRLVEFYSSEGHGDAQAALERWYDIAEKAEWKNGRLPHNRLRWEPTLCL